MFGLLDISASGMIAQRTRLEVATANIAGAHALTGPDGEYDPFRRRMVHLGVGDPRTGNQMGVHVSEIEVNDGPLRMRFDPGSQFSNEDGYVGYPDIDPTMETINAIDATRAYEANVMAAEATKAMVATALRLLA